MNNKNVKTILNIALCYTSFLYNTNATQVFTYIYHNNGFHGKESISGPGSNLFQTKKIRKVLPKIFRKYNIKSIMDAPCGDFFWMRYIDLKNINYIGIDVVRELILKNNKEFSCKNIKFIEKDLLNSKLPKADLILCRDLLVHLSFDQIKQTIKNFKQTGSTYILTTTFTNQKRKNHDIPMGSWRPLNLQLAPFNFPKPILTINENCTEGNNLFNDKSLSLWCLKDLNF